MEFYGFLTILLVVLEGHRQVRKPASNLAFAVVHRGPFGMDHTPLMPVLCFLLPV